MQAAKLANLLNSGAQVKVVGVAQQNLDIQLFEDILRYAFDRGQRADRHEDRSFDFTVRGDQSASAGLAGSGRDLELEGHWRKLYKEDAAALGLLHAWDDFKDHSVRRAVLQRQSPDAHRELKPPRPCAAGIEIEQTVLRLLLRNVTVARNNRGKSGRFGLQVELGEVVKNINRDAPDFEHVGGWNLLCPGSLIHVAADGGHRCNSCEFAEDGGIADVSGMNDVVGALQRGQSFGAEKAMSVGDNANEHR